MSDSTTTKKKTKPKNSIDSVAQKLVDLWMEAEKNDPASDGSFWGSGFWHLANSLDTAVQYLEADATADHKAVGELVDFAVEKITATDFSGFPGYWWDDIDHWGNALLRTHHYIAGHPTETKGWKTTAEAALLEAFKGWWMLRAFSWGGVCWPKDGLSWYHYPTANGCWNFPPVNEAGTATENGAQNAVTNTTYLQLSTTFYGLVTSDAKALAYLQGQRKSNGYFDKIYTQFGATAPKGLSADDFLEAAAQSFHWFDTIGDDFYLSCRKDGSVGGHINDTAAPGWSTFVNSALQSQFPAALIALWHHREAVAKLKDAPSLDNLEKYARRVLRAAQHLFHGDVLCEAPFSTNYSLNPQDLGTGKGIFMRYFATILADPAFATFFTAAEKKTFEKQIATTAARVAELPLDANDVLPIQWVEDLASFAKSFHTWWGPLDHTSKGRYDGTDGHGGSSILDLATKDPKTFTVGLGGTGLNGAWGPPSNQNYPYLDGYASSWDADESSLLFQITRQASGLGALTAAVQTGATKTTT